VFTVLTRALADALHPRLRPSPMMHHKRLMIEAKIMRIVAHSNP
jgi:hypothetical protein